VPFGDDLRHDAADRGCWHGKPNSRISSALAEDHRVHTDEGSRRVQEGTATIARIDRGVRLNHVANGDPSDTLNLPTKGADDASRKRMIEAEGVADCYCLLADIKAGVLPNRYGLEELARGIDLEHGDVLSGLDANQPAVEGLLTLKRDSERASPLHDMEVRDNVPEFIPDESRAAPGGDLLFISEEVDQDASLGHEDRAWRHRSKDGNGVALILRPRTQTERGRGRQRRGWEPRFRPRCRGRWRRRSTRYDGREPQKRRQDEALGTEATPCRALGKHQPCSSRGRPVLFLDAKENHRGTAPHLHRAGHLSYEKKLHAVESLHSNQCVKM